MNPHCFFIGTTLGNNPVPHHFVALSNELVHRGHRVVILAPHRKSELENDKSNPAIYSWPSDRPTQLRDAAFLRRLVQKYRPSCFIANFVAVNVMTTMGCMMHVPVRVAWYHTVTGQLMHDNAMAGWKRRLLAVRKSFVYQAATHLIANSAASADDLQQTYAVPKSKCRVFHNAIADPFSNGMRMENPVPDGRFVCVGRLYPSKGQDILIKAVALLRNKNPSLQVEFIGEGPSQETYERLARQLGVRDKCTFSGRLDHTEVLRRMSTALATIVPSRSEAFGLVNIESLAVGTPVIASSVGGIVEIIRDRLDGFLVPPDDPDALAARMNQLFSNPHLRREMRVHAREQFLARFEQRRAVLEQADWHETLVSKSESVPFGKISYGEPA